MSTCFEVPATSGEASAACLFGWPGLLSVAFICLGCYICKDRREKPGAILSFIEKIGK